MEKLLYIIRHGQTDLNRQGIVQGRGVDSPLNEIGLQQAEAFYDRYRQTHFDHIYTSRLLRTRQTVAPFLRDGVPHSTHEGLDEISWGIYEGKEQTPDIISGFDQLTGLWKEGQLHMAVEAGESPLELIERQKIAMQHILSHADHQQVLICMHGRAMRILLAWFTGQDPALMDTFPHTNTALYIVRAGHGPGEIIDFYNTAHLNHSLR